VGAALAMAKGTSSVGSAGGADKPPLQHPRRWGLGHMAEQGRVSVTGHRMARPGIGPTQRREGERALVELEIMQPRKGRR